MTDRFAACLAGTLNTAAQAAALGTAATLGRTTGEPRPAPTLQ